MIRLKLFLLFMLASWRTISAQMTGPWGDQGDGTYRNPVIAADYSDPDPLRVGDDYYMAVSTFKSYPGVTILHSKDLVNWTTIGAALTELADVDSAFTFRRMNRYNGGTYAPAITFHNGLFYVYVNLVTDGFLVATARHPAGPWKSQFLKDKYGRPLRVPRWTDPCPFWDDNGKAYLMSSRPGRKYWYSYIFQMSEDGTTLLDADSAHMALKDTLYQYPNGGTLVSPYHSSEGNRIFKRNGWYYLQHIEFLNAGLGEGTYVFRSRHLYGTQPDGTPGKPGHPGEYEIFAVNRIKHRDSLYLPGQGGYVDTSDGRWFWMGQFNRNYACGRPPHLLPVTWVDDWPVIGVDVKGKEGQMGWLLPKPVQGVFPRSLPQGSDDFSEVALHPRWMWNHVPDDGMWFLTERRGYLRLRVFPTVDRKGFFKAGNTLNQRYMCALSATVTVKMEITGMADGQKAGLAHFNGGKTYAFIGVVQEGGRCMLSVEMNGLETGNRPLEQGVQVVYLRTVWGLEDKVVFQYSTDGTVFHELGGAYPVTPGNFRGDMVGIFTYNDAEAAGYVDVDWFHYDVTNIKGM